MVPRKTSARLAVLIAAAAVTIALLTIIALHSSDDPSPEGPAPRISTAPLPVSGEAAPRPESSPAALSASRNADPVTAAPSNPVVIAPPQDEIEAEVADPEIVDPPVTAFGRVVRSDDRQPIAGALITVNFGIPTRRASQPSARSGADGRFEIMGLKPRFAEVVFVSAEGWAGTGRFVIYEHFVAGKGVDVGDIELYPGRTLRGRVVDADRKPIAGAAVFSCSDSFRRHAFADLRLLATTNASGTFHVDHIPVEPGDLDILVAASEEGAGWMEPDAKPTVSEVEAEIVIGRSTSATVSVVDEHGEAVRDAIVSALPCAENLYRPDPCNWFPPGVRSDTLPSLFRTRTNEAGVARFPSLPATQTGTPYLFWAALPGSPGEPPATLGSLFEGDPDGLSGSLGAAPFEGRIILRRPPLAALAGEVVERDGTPIAGARVRRSDDGSMAVTDTNGAFRFAEAEIPSDGRWRLEVDAPGFAQAEVYPSKPDGVRVVLFPGRLIEGTLTDSRGNPIPQIGIALARPGSSIERLADRTFETRTDARGRFRFPSVKEGSWRVSLASEHDFSDPSILWPSSVVKAGDRDVRLILGRR